MVTPDLQSAIALYKRGERDEARRRVAAICKASPDNADAWYVAAMMTEGDQRIRLLERALAIDPFHDKASAALNKGEPATRKATPQPASAALTYALIAVAAVVLIGLVGFGMSRFMATGAAEQNPTREIGAGTIATATMGSTPTSVLLATSTLAPTIGITATPAPFEITATAYRFAAQTAQADLHATATSAALTYVPAGS